VAIPERAQPAVTRPAEWCIGGVGDTIAGA
jgi:hypothetical protein